MDIQQLAAIMTVGSKDIPDRLVCHPGVAERLKELSEPVKDESERVRVALTGVAVIPDETLKEHEWKVFSGEKLLLHCFPNPFREGELIVMRPPVFDLRDLRI